jgi:hypothetical protein
MKVLLTDKLLEDIGSLPKALAGKAQRVAVQFTRLSRQDMQDKLTAGWRIHKLKSSPFMSFSLDMNYRLLCRIDGETIALHRIVKHDRADNPQVNREDSRDACLTLNSSQLRIPDLYACLQAIGLRDGETSRSDPKANCCARGSSSAGPPTRECRKAALRVGPDVCCIALSQGLAALAGAINCLKIPSR